MPKTKLTTFLAIISFALFGVAGVASAAVNECDNWQTNHPEWLFCDDFEAGVYSSGWNLIWSTIDDVIVAAPTDSAILTTPPARSGNVSKIHYYIDSTTPHQDSNRHMDWVSATNLTHLFVRGYVLIPNNTQISGTSNSIQRKLYYFFSSNYISGSTGFHFMLITDSTVGNTTTIPMRMSYNIGGETGTAATLWNIANLAVGKWVAVEVEYQLNTPNVADGIFRLWLDDVLSYENTALNFRGTSAVLRQVNIGNQVDRQNSDPNPVDEYRYWDDIVISTARIYSLVFSDITPPSAPANLAANVISATQINLTWAASTDNVGVVGYNIYRDGVQIATSTTTSYSNTGLTASTAYSYTVFAYDAAGNNSTQSTSASATTQARPDTTPPSAPSGLVVN